MEEVEKGLIPLDQANMGLYRYFGSNERVKPLIAILSNVSPDQFWPTFFETWPMCDATGQFNNALLKLLRQQKIQGNEWLKYVSPHIQKLYKTLPDVLTIYRGCVGPTIEYSGTVRRISWTLDRKIAEGFGRGHRSIKLPNPVVAEANYPKAEILALNLKRREREVLIDPRRLRGLKLHHHSTISQEE
jgi:hypothetical protein